jgi:hypothetical protein
MVLDFLVGLRRYGPRARLGLVAWEHVDCLYEYPLESLTGAPSKRPPKEAKGNPIHPAVMRIIPDATGLVVAGGDSLQEFATTRFWLEVDRGTERGQALLDKFHRYYKYARSQSHRNDALPLLLIVVEHRDQPRLQYLCGRLIALERHYQLALDVRLARADRLTTSRHGLDPTRMVWRTVHSAEDTFAFNQAPAPAVAEPKS